MRSNSLYFASILMIVFALNACQSNDTFYTEVTSYQEGWPHQEPTEFKFDVTDTINHYDLFLKSEMIKIIGLETFLLLRISISLMEK